MFVASFVINDSQNNVFTHVLNGTDYFFVCIYYQYDVFNKEKIVTNFAVFLFYGKVKPTT